MATTGQRGSRPPCGNMRQSCPAFSIQWASRSVLSASSRDRSRVEIGSGNVDTHVHILWMERVGCSKQVSYVSTCLPPKNAVTRRNIGTCEIVAGAYLIATRHLGSALRPVSQRQPSGGFERHIRGESRRLRFSLILVITPARTGEASRVLHPPRSSASGCSANGRSATRSDSQRSHRRTRWDGHPAWESKPRLYRALPSGVPAKRRQVKEERRQRCSDLG